MNDFHSHSLAAVLDALKTGLEGLSEDESLKRRAKHGENRLSSQKPPGALSIFLSQFKNSLIYVLLFTGLLSLLIGSLKEAGVIFAAVFINVIFGFFQENKANQALNKLRSMSEHKAVVLRKGLEHRLRSRDIVPGDIIVLKAGNRVPCDCRIIEANSLEINESSLTGESMPVKKLNAKLPVGTALADRINMAYSGTVVLSGNGRAVSVAIGSETELGRIATMVREAHEDKTPLQVRLEKFSRLLGALFLSVCTVIVVVGLSQDRPLLEMIETGVAVGVASIPEGLTVAITFILALGMQKMLAKKALTRKLVAAETLGSTTVICSDKTGTLTKGKMSVDHIVIGEKEFEIKNPGSRQNQAEARIVSLALQTAMMCNDAAIENPDEALSEWKFIGTPTEVALYRAAIESGLRKEDILKFEPKIAEQPFDSERKYMLSLHRHKNGTYVLYEKGAPEVLLAKSSHYYHQGSIQVLASDHKQKLVKNYEKMTATGLRVIGVAIKHFGHRENDIESDKINWSKIDVNLCFVGFIAIKDPLRPEAKETIEAAILAGIRPIIITGDHRLTARAIAKEVGLKSNNENILIGEELEKISDEDLEKQVMTVDIYARVSPHHKLRIIRALQANGEVVAMTGDGINDSPALKAADIGIALGTGTDIAKETADIVLLDDNFRTILSAIKQGRIMFRNIQKVITYLISDSFSEMILIFGSIMVHAPLAVLPAQILWINIVNDSWPNFSLAFEKGDKNIMLQKPIDRKEPLLNREMSSIIFGVGLIRDLIVFGVFFVLYLSWRGNEELIPLLQTIIFATLGVKSLMSIFSLRHFHIPIWRYSPFSNPMLIGAVFISFALLIAAIEWAPLRELLGTVPLSAKEWAIPFLIGFIGVAMIELVKLRFMNIEKVKSV